MPMLPVAFSLMATFTSSLMLLGTPAEIYTTGTQFVVINLTYGKKKSFCFLYATKALTFYLSGLATPIVAYLFLPVFYKLNATSAYEV
jgi:solute carrier family 5 (sodium-coupled monocarboxylate transporter), member 8/12